MSWSGQHQGLGPPQAKRLKISVACYVCRARKVKCDGERPACGNCQKKEGLRGSCTYRSAAAEPEATSSGRPAVPSDASDTPLPRLPEQLELSKANSEPLDGPEAHEAYRGGVPGVFAGEVNAAIDARLGLPPGGRPSLIPIPMTDAPLFRPLSHGRVADKSDYHEDNVLPPRKHADRLLELYWLHIQPLEPFLEQERFSDSYQALFAGNPLNADERIFVSTLNAAFALSTQLQEDVEPEQRAKASETYFRRAWTLLRPEAIIWGPGSLELVQCLLLLGRYLQCTSNPHQTWMAVGSAVRIAQSLGLHLPDASPPSPSSRDSRLRRQVWECCVFMDRGLSWVLGRTSMASLITSSATDTSPYGTDQEDQFCVPAALYSTKMIELYEISNHIMLSQESGRGGFVARLGLPTLYHNNEYIGTALQLDACLKKWEKSLPQDWRADIDRGNADNALSRQGVILRFRLLHARILLFRPMLSRLCFSQSQPDRARDEGLSDRVLKDCASLCVDNAKKIIALIRERHNPGREIGILPWWHRVFYLYVAGITLMAAMLRPDLFESVALRWWHRVVDALRAHEHLSPFVEQCLATFLTLSCKISETHHPGGGEASMPKRPSNAYFQDVFQDLGFDPDSLLFGMDDMSWLTDLGSSR